MWLAALIMRKWPGIRRLTEDDLLGFFALQQNQIPYQLSAISISLISLSASAQFLISSLSAIAEKVISHLAGIVGSRVSVTLEISAEIPSGVPDQIVRTVTENSRTLKFKSQGFERE